MKPIAIVGLLMALGVGTAYSAPPVKEWCSDGFEKPAELSLSQPPVFKVGDKIEQLDPEFWPEDVTFATIDYALEGDEHKDEQIVIYQDRVFWPCK
jgi:hypothetical protein